MQDVKVSLTGMKDETSLTKGIVETEVRRNIERWSRFSRVNLVNIDVRRADKGGRTRYEVRIEATGEGSHHADASGWNLEGAMHEALDRLGKEIIRKKEKLKA
jgi:ribosome-associated translation inhibitor RaiA